MTGAPARATELPASGWEALRGADVVVFGEIHDNPHHHANQAAAVQALEPGALVFEQLTPELARRITPELIADPEALAEALDWEARGWPDFSIYYPIFAAAPEAVVFGGGLPVDEVRRAVSEGAAPVFGDGAPLFGLDEPFPEAVQAELEAGQQAAHCNALPDEMLPGMVEAQRLRDAALARATLAAWYEANAAGAAPVVVITGNGHAGNEMGVPPMLRRQQMGLTVRSVGQFEDSAPEAPGFDHWMVTPGVERGDPCAAFTQGR